MDTVRGWMRHSVQLARDRLDKLTPPPNPLPVDREGEYERVRKLREWLVYEVAARERVLAAAGNVGGLSVYDQVWHWYMVEKAELQVRRYGQRVSEVEFRATSGWLRRERDARLKLLMKERGAA
jgi:hypothetical protein